MLSSKTKATALNPTATTPIPAAANKLPLVAAIEPANVKISLAADNNVLSLILPSLLSFINLSIFISKEADEIP